MPTLFHSTCPSGHLHICSLQDLPLTRNQLRLCTIHMINCVIADDLMPSSSLRAHQPSLHHGYVFAAQSILLETIAPPSHSTIHLIGAIINKDTGDVLEYHRLMKLDKHKHVWAHSFSNKLGQLFQGIRNIPGTDLCFFIPKLQVPAQ
jgi:hypothetical protein